MIVWRRSSTPLLSASASAFFSGRTLKPTMIAPEADASSTSLMLIAPTPTWRSDLHFLVGKVLQGLGQDLGRAGHVSLDDQRQLLDAAFLDLVEELIERKLLAGGHRLLALPELAERGDRARFRFVRNDLERVARLREILAA